MNQVVWASKYSFYQSTIGHLQGLYDNTNNQQVRVHLTRQLRALAAESADALGKTSAFYVDKVGKTLGGLYFAAKIYEITQNNEKRFRKSGEAAAANGF